ncbi:MAG: hypothetical protein ACRCZ2_03100 [Fusobacteriaceae bacterium]
MKEEKSFLIKTIISIISILLIVGGLNYFCDPFQIFKFTKYGNGEQRYINYGIARNYKYDTAIIGTSTSENILKNDLKQIFDVNAVNLSVSGSTNYEQRELLKQSLENQNLKTVIYGLDIFSYNREINEIRLEIPEYIKYPYKISVLKQIFSFLTLKNSIKGIVKNIMSPNKESWINYHSYWGDQHTYSKEITISRSKGEEVIKGFENCYSLIKMKGNFDIFLEMTQTNKNIEYIIYLPPYSFLFWNLIEQYGSLNAIMDFKYYILTKTASKQNIKIYDFQNNFEIAENLNNYKDIIHYSPEINKEILKLIKQEKYLETLETSEKNSKIFLNKIQEWKKMSNKL